MSNFRAHLFGSARANFRRFAPRTALAGGTADTIISLVRVSFYEAAPCSPSFSCVGRTAARELTGRRRSTTRKYGCDCTLRKEENEKECRRVRVSSSDLTMTHSDPIAVNGHSTTHISHESVWRRAMLLSDPNRTAIVCRDLRHFLLDRIPSSWNGSDPDIHSQK